MTMPKRCPCGRSPKWHKSPGNFQHGSERYHIMPNPVTEWLQLVGLALFGLVAGLVLGHALSGWTP